MARVHLRHVSFRYPIYQMTGRSLKVSLLNQFAGGRVGAQAGVVKVQALKDISFTLEPGDRLGLIGRNGSGKSTLLRLLAGLAKPQLGEMAVSGRLVPLIEKGLGIHPELSGLANIELPLRLLGATTEEVRLAKREIGEFTGLGQFMNLPVRTYSDGMRTRLAFAISTAIAADILVLDEWLSAGDIDFHVRAQERLTSVMEQTKIVVLASHSLDLISNVCTKVAWLDRGNLVMLGEPGAVVGAYTRSQLGPRLVAATA